MEAETSWPLSTVQMMKTDGRRQGRWLYGQQKMTASRKRERLSQGDTPVKHLFKRDLNCRPAQTAIFKQGSSLTILLFRSEFYFSGYRPLDNSLSLFFFTVACFIGDLQLSVNYSDQHPITFQPPWHVSSSIH